MRSIWPEAHRFEASITWDGKTGGFVRSRGFELLFDMPKVFGGLGRGFCPDELFLSALGCCLITTLLSFKQRFDFNVKSLQAGVEGEVRLAGSGGYRIKAIRVHIKASTSEDEVERVKRYLELAREYCHITRSIEGCIPIDVQIEVVSG